MLSQLKTLLSSKGQDRGFTLIELLIVVLIVGILAAVAVPLYLGYVKDAKMVEGKSIAGALWTSMQAAALANCGNDVSGTLSYNRAGLGSNGMTADSRWQAGTAGSLSVDCTLGTYTATPADQFVITAQATDVSPMKVKLTYTTGGTPPAQVQCANDGTNYTPC